MALQILKDLDTQLYLKNPEVIRRNQKNGKIAEYNKKVGLIHEALWKRINETVRNNKESARAIGNYLKLTGSQSNHWHKAGAEFVAFSTKLTKRKKGESKYEYEHAMPATAAYMYLMDVALHKDYNFESAYRVVMDNYKLIALDKAMDDKLRIAGLQRGMQKGWRLGENFWWQRYFNTQVAAVDGGINPQSLEMTNGRLMGDQIRY